MNDCCRCWCSWLVVMMTALLSTPSTSVAAQEPSDQVGEAAAMEDRGLEDHHQRFSEVLSLADWDESRFSKFADHEPLTLDEQLEMWRLIERLTMLDRRWVHRRYGRPVKPSDLISSPATYRGALVRLSGIARKVETQVPDPDDQARLAINKFYRVTIEVEGTPVVVVTPIIPKRWGDLVPLVQPVEVAGVFVKLADDPLGKATPLIVATRVAWYPAKVDSPTVNYGMSILGILEVDVAQFDRLRQRRTLSAADAPAFYEVLEGVGRSRVPQLQAAADRQLRQVIPYWQTVAEQSAAANDQRRHLLAKTVLQEAREGRYSVAPFFNTPHEQIGAIASFRGNVRSALRIEIEPQTAALHGGLDHYYQLALFTSDSQNYPVFFCVRELPQGFPLGEDIDVPVRIAGFFLKMWQYRSRMEAADTRGGETAQESLQPLQAPLFVAISPEVLPRPVSDRTWGYIAAAGVLLLLAAVVLVEWARWRRDRRFASTTLARVQQSTRDFDFERLAEADRQSPTAGDGSHADDLTSRGAADLDDAGRDGRGGS